MAQRRQRVTVTVPILTKRLGPFNPGDKIRFGISPTTPLHKLFVSYSARQDVPLGSLCWLFDGMAVRGDQTPADLGLEAGGKYDFVAALTWSPPPGRLPPKGLRKVLEYLPLDGPGGVHEAKQVSFCWWETGRSAITLGRWKPVNWVALHGKRSMMGAGAVPASVLSLCRAAWAVDPNETLRILFTWGLDIRAASRFLAIVEPSIHGLGRIVRLLEPAHRFVYAKNQMYRWWDENELGYWQKMYAHTTIDVIKHWARYMDTALSRWMPPPHLTMESHNLVVSYVSEALQSWTDAAVAADFFCCFFNGNYPRPVPDLGDFTRGWDDGKASAFAAAYAADVALSRHGPTLAGLKYPDLSYGFEVMAFRVEELIQLEQGAGDEEFDQATESMDGHLMLVERAAEFPGKYY